MTPTEPRPRTRYTVAQRQEFLAQYQRSGLSTRAFAREQGINLSTLYQWLSKLKSKPGAAQPAFKEVLLSSTFVSSWTAELSVGPELTLRLNSQVSADFIARIIEQLRHPC